MIIISHKDPTIKDYRKNRYKNVLWYNKKDECVWITRDHIVGMWDKVYIPSSKDVSNEKIIELIEKQFPDHQSIIYIEKALSKEGERPTTLNKYPEFLTPTDLVKLGLYPSTDASYLARARGEGPEFIKLKRKVLYSKEAVMKWVIEKTQQFAKGK
jgi:hypothetical protein